MPATDIQQLVFNRWRTLIETPHRVPLYTAKVATNLALPYARAEFVTSTRPIGRGRWMGESTVRITIYAASERTIQGLFAACGFESIDSTGFHKVEIGDSSVKATSRIIDSGSPTAESDPPFGGGSCFSRVLVLAVRTGSKA